MLEIKDIYASYGSANVLSGASLSVRGGQILAVIGKNGSGKTTLFKNILGINKPNSGRILFEGEDLQKMPRRERARLMKKVFGE